MLFGRIFERILVEDFVGSSMRVRQRKSFKIWMPFWAWILGAEIDKGDEVEDKFWTLFFGLNTKYKTWFGVWVFGAIVEFWRDNGAWFCGVVVEFWKEMLSWCCEATTNFWIGDWP